MPVAPGTRRSRQRAAPPPDRTPPVLPPPGDANTGTIPRVVTGRRRTVLVLLAVVAVLSAAGLVAGLLSWAPEPPEPPRAASADERARLDAMRVTNYRDLRAGVHVTAGTGGARVELVGWVDWSRALAYLDVGGPGAGPERGLLQATPTVAVLRPDPGAVPTPAPPPLVPPTDRWRLHELPAGRGPAPLLDLLFSLAADRRDPAGDPAAVRWVGRDTVEGEPVDILQAPPPGSPSPPARDGGQRHWLDRDARLHRLETRLPGTGPVTVTLNRTNRPTLRPVDALGGRPGLPRALEPAEQDRLDRLPARLRARGGATVTLTAPVGTATNLRGAGWVDWRGRITYLTVADVGVPDRRTLLRRAAGRTTRLPVPAGTVGGTAEAPARPPLPPPARGWRADPARDDVAVLLDLALRAGAAPPEGTARRIRGDSLAGQGVDVVEVRTARTVLRYWIDRTGLLRRLELRTRPGTWAQLDLRPGPVPRLGGPAPARPTAGASGR
ncbi:hypothetical protein [Micromonospora sp. NPDC049497]|uniref:hypothetical protein n=1 Tax=Micromonospora sp. NPDC049497 TaxID=3364273 RepID=UPI0037BBF8CC